MINAESAPDMLETVVGLLLPLTPLALCILAASLWRRQLRPRLQPLPPPRDRSGGLLALFLVGWVGTQTIYALVAGLRGGLPDTLGPVLALQSGANLVAVAAVVLLARRTPGGPAALGLRPRRPLLDPPAALLAWLIVLPILAAGAWLNQAALEWLELPTGIQDHLQRFLAEGDAATPWPWLAMVLVIPFCEELVFRGALYGGLRRLVPAWAAMLLSGLVFGLSHDPQVMLPVAALGVMLAWLYERTGSLAAPTLLHGLQNAATLALATWFPESLT
ncbi:MAG: hypothetical protein DRQ55_12140 [Planctomycetota bacterium]|nr:MAG: hypothetical protein DRQ55_12140 [Planctomycetota bacterium]